MRRSAGVITIGAVLLASVPAWAEDADSLVTRGLELRLQGKDDQALELFRKADASSPSPRTHAQVALAEQALGMWVPAWTHLEEALAVKQDAWIEKNRAALTNALAVVQKHTGFLEVRGGVAGAEVLVDGARLGTLPLRAPLRVEAGRRTLSVRAPGYYATSRTTDVLPSDTTRETVELVRDEAPGMAAAPGTPILVSAEPGSLQRTLGWLTVGVGGALLATGAIGLVLRQAAVSSYNDDPSCPGRGSAQQPPGCQDYISTANTWKAVSTASFVAGGVLAVGGVVLLFTAPSAKKQSGLAACGVSTGLVGGGLACVGRF